MRRYDETLLTELNDYIIGQQREYGSSPSYGDIVRNLPTSFSSKSKARNYVKVLQGRGLLKIDGDGSIAVDVRFQLNPVSAPLVGNVACGQPITAIENIEGSFALPAEIFGYGELMLLRAKGNSMTNVGIDNGDLIVIRKQEYAYSGQMVLAIIYDGATVKTYLPQEDGTVILRPENEDYDDIEVEEFQIQGIVVGCIKTYR